MGNHMFLRVLSSVVVVFVLGIAPTLSIMQTATAETNPTTEPHSEVLISELQTRSTTDANEEFVELYNTTDAPVDITDWLLEYKSATGTAWTNKIRGTQYVEPVFVIEPGDFYLIATQNFSEAHDDVPVHQTLSSGSAEGGGHIRLLRPDIDVTEDEAYVEVDRVAWGSATDILEDTEPAIAPERGQSIFRCFIGAELQVSYDNSLDFLVSETPQPGYGYDCPATDADDSHDDSSDDSSSDMSDSDDQTESDSKSGNDDTTDTDDSEDHQNDNEEKDVDEDISEGDATDSSATELGCEGVVFSEVLPNPQGPRSEFPREENAFIELHNATNEPVSLNGCGLQTSANSSIYWFAEDEQLEPHAFVAWYEKDTKVQLPVSPSGTVYLLNSDNDEVESVTYPENMPEAGSYSWFGDNNWEVSFSPSPNNKNIEQSLRPCPEGQERNPNTNRCRNIEQTSTELVPCLEGQERNPETNRCISVNQATRDLVPCAPNQERNPETNRCRLIDQSSRQLVPCAPHQERNPETNRCRNIESASSELKPCAEGQERNPETNRCRTVAQPNSEVMSVQDIKVAQEEPVQNWVLSGSFLGFALLYGAWEWRLDAKRLLVRLGQRLSK